MTAPKIVLLGDVAEAEKLRGFALSQLRMLHNAMEFQGLKQYTRLVRFSDSSYVKTFSSFGIDLVTVFVPPVSVPPREVAEIEEGVFIAAGPCGVASEVSDPEFFAGTAQWVLKETGKANAFESNCPFQVVACCAIDDQYFYEDDETKKWRVYGYWEICDDWNCEGCDWIDWKDNTTGNNVLYPPPCGSPAECHGGFCEGSDCEQPLCCISRYYQYYEWEYV